jgi:hypothetical protein
VDSSIAYNNSYSSGSLPPYFPQELIQGNDFQYQTNPFKNPAWLFWLYFKIAIMNTTESLFMEMPFSAVEINKVLVSGDEDKNITPDKGRTHPINNYLSINNYLKTPEEIDAELSSEMNSPRETLAEHKFLMEIYGRIFKNRSDNAYNPDNNPSGFMEENY